MYHNLYDQCPNVGYFQFFAIEIKLIMAILCLKFFPINNTFLESRISRLKYVNTLSLLKPKSRMMWRMATLSLRVY